MTKKILTALLILVGLFIFVPANAAPPEDKPGGKPFEELREDVNELEENVAALQEEVLDKEKSGIWKTIHELQDKVEVLENQVADLIGRVTNLENWKTLMEEWKTSIETWKQSIAIQLAELDSRITDEVAKLNDAINVVSTDLNLKMFGLATRVASLEDPNTILEKTKQVDSSGSGLDADLLDGLDSNDFARTNGAYPDLSVGYATNAKNADTVDGKHVSELLSLWTDGGEYIYPNNVGDSFQITNVGDLYIPSNIGISTAGPTQKLHIFSETTDAAIRLETGQRPGSHNFTMGVDNGDNKFKINVGHYLDYTNQFVIEEGGNVGIGTSDPQYTLHIESYRPGNWAASIVNTAGSSNGYGLLLESLSLDSSAYNLFEATNKNGSKFIIKGNGNVGIGTSEPDEKLTVVGVIESTSGGFKFPDGTAQTTAAGAGNINVYTGIIDADNSIALLRESVVTLEASTYYGGGHCSNIGASLYINGEQKRNAGQSGCYHNSDTLSMSYTTKLPAGNYFFKYTRIVNDASVYSDYFVIIVQTPSQSFAENFDEEETEVNLPPASEEPNSLPEETEESLLP